ncbi:MAG: ACP S-malonyltransferase [Deltaproteobacteria bacterium]|nr:ACP S-malonyltransferase [Deltaproteobacteria bacterium]
MEKSSNSNIAFVFPGQGSQHAGMGKDIFENFNEARLILEESSDTLGLDMKSLILGDDGAALNLTENTQPALLTVSTAILRVIEKETGLKPVCVSGHSLGEYSANVSAGSVDFSNALLIAKKRGFFMQTACPVGFGKMAAVIGLNENTIKTAIGEVNHLKNEEGVFIANINSEIQTVISGMSPFVDEACLLLKERGAKKIVVLPVSAPFHTPFMESAKENLSSFIDRGWFRDAECDIFSNAASLNYSKKDDAVRLLLEQIVSPVMWKDIIVNMEKISGVSKFIEVGPSNVLSGLIKRIDKNADVLSVNSVSAVKELESLMI